MCNLFLIFFVDVLIVVYKPSVYLIDVKVHLTFIYFSLQTNYFFGIESIHAFYFVNNVVAYKALLILGKGGKFV